MPPDQPVPHGANPKRCPTCHHPKDERGMVLFESRNPNPATSGGGYRLCHDPFHDTPAPEQLSEFRDRHRVVGKTSSTSVERVGEDDLREEIYRCFEAVSKGDSPDVIAAFIWSRVASALEAAEEDKEGFRAELKRWLDKYEALRERAEAAERRVATLEVGYEGAREIAEAEINANIELRALLSRRTEALETVKAMLHDPDLQNYTGAGASSLETALEAIEDALAEEEKK